MYNDLLHTHDHNTDHQLFASTNFLKTSLRHFRINSIQVPLKQNQIFLNQLPRNTWVIEIQMIVFELESSALNLHVVLVGSVASRIFFLPFLSAEVEVSFCSLLLVLLSFHFEAIQ